MSESSREKSNSNLISSDKKTLAERQAMGRNGGKALGVANAKRRAMREFGKQILNLPLDKADKKLCKALGLKSKDIQNKGYLAFVSCLQRATLDGNASALEKLFNMAGELSEDSGGMMGGDVGRTVVMLSPKVINLKNEDLINGMPKAIDVEDAEVVHKGDPDVSV